MHLEDVFYALEIIEFSADFQVFGSIENLIKRVSVSS